MIIVPKRFHRRFCVDQIMPFSHERHHVKVQKETFSLVAIKRLSNHCTRTAKRLKKGSNNIGLESQRERSGTALASHLFQLAKKYSSTQINEKRKIWKERENVTLFSDINFIPIESKGEEQSGVENIALSGQTCPAGSCRGRLWSTY